MPEPETSELGRGVAGGANGGADELQRGRLALARVAELERELALVRHHQDAKIAELEERLGWFEEHELDLRAQVERRPWLRASVGLWSSSVRVVRRLARLSK